MERARRDPQVAAGEPDRIEGQRQRLLVEQVDACAEREYDQAARDHVADLHRERRAEGRRAAVRRLQCGRADGAVAAGTVDREAWFAAGFTPEFVEVRRSAERHAEHVERLHTGPQFETAMRGQGDEVAALAGAGRQAFVGRNPGGVDEAPLVVKHVRIVGTADQDDIAAERIVGESRRAVRSRAHRGLQLDPLVVGEHPTFRRRGQ